MGDARKSDDVFTPRDIRLAVMRFGASAAAGTISYQVFQANFMTLFVSYMGFPPWLIGTLFLAIQAPAVLQIWAARYAARRGGRRMILIAYGWGPLAMLPVILAPQAKAMVGYAAAVAAVFTGLTVYSLANSIGNAVWMPMLRKNLPARRSAELVGRMNRIAMLAALATTLAFSFFLGAEAVLWRFQAVFALVVVFSALRAAFLRNARDIEQEPDADAQPLWRDLGEVWGDMRFRRLVIFMSIAFFSASLVAPFRPLYVKELGFSQLFTVIVTTPLILGVYGMAAPAWGYLADRYGSRSIQVVTGAGVVVAQFIMALPSHHGTLDAILIIAASVVVQVCWAGFDAANTRRAFSIVPPRNETLYLVVFQLAVMGPVSVGAFVGGALVDWLHRALPAEGLAPWMATATSYRIVYLIAGALHVAAVVYSLRIVEPRQVSTPKLLFYMRLRTQRWLMSGLSPAFFFLRRKRDEED